jgi:hypothetical protein
MQVITRAAALTLAVLTANCTEWVPASVATATGEPHVLVHPQTASPSIALVAPSRRTLQELKAEGARFEVRRTSGERTVVATLAIVLGAGVLVGLAAYAASLREPFALQNR